MATPRESYTPRGDTFIGRSGPYEHLQPTTPRPSSAPSYSATTRNIFPQRSDSPADTVTRPSTRHENKDTRNPITGEVREASKTPRGKKLVPTYFENLQAVSGPKRGKGRSQGVDTSRAGLPTFIQRIRIHEEDIYHKRPSTAPSPTTTTSLDSSLLSNPPPLDTLPSSPVRARRPAQIEHLVVRRNPLLENDDVKQKHRPMSKSNYESNQDVAPVQRKPNIKHAMHQTRPGFIPMDEPAPPPIKLRPFVPDDNEDVFYYRHAQGICPPDSTVLLARENERTAQEGKLKEAHKDRKVELDYQIQQHKERIARWKARKNGTNV